jgi:hypothetical protein
MRLKTNRYDEVRPGALLVHVSRRGLTAAGCVLDRFQEVDLA